MDEIEFERIFECYSQMVYKIAFLYLKNEADALDIVQNTFFKLLKKKDFNNEEHIKRWLLRITVNLCKNNLKSYWQRNVVSFEEKYYFQNNRDLNLQELIFKLSPRYKGVVHLYYYEGYSVKEIAAILKISDSAVKQRLKRAREKLKIELEGGS